MVLVLVRHAESIENATKHDGFYRDPRPYGTAAAIDISRHLVGLSPTGFGQSQWLEGELAPLVGPELRVFTSTYRRSIDTATLAFPTLRPDRLEQTVLLDEQHYGEATYMTKPELFRTFPDTEADRTERKHLWTPPGGGESLADGVTRRAADFIAMARSLVGAGRDVVAVTHHTTMLALRALLEDRPVTDLVEQARVAKTPNAAVLRYTLDADGTFTGPHLTRPTA
jgi:broad specificity phosphatase PhoE